MTPKRESVKIPKETMKLYRKWAKDTGRTLTALLDAALVFAHGKQAEVEHGLKPKP